jgi:hypothetical protein
MNNNLYVITCISNPVRYHSRYALYKDFEKRMKDAGVILYTVEMAFGNRPFSITTADNPHHIQLRSYFELWHKENMLNIGIRRLPIDWEYAAWIDADVAFTRPDWAEETVQQLQHYMIVQMFSNAIDLSPHHEVTKTHTGFVHDWYHNPESVRRGGYATFSHPGFAWAARREAIDYVGGLMTHGILGSGDRHMACAMIGKVEHSYHKDVTQDYKDKCLEWQRRCQKHIKKDLGYVSGTISHYWHGAKGDRKYNDRWKILVENQFKPDRDAYPDSQGLLQIDDDRIQLRDDIRRYFRSRFEDSDWTGFAHKMLP